MKTYITTMTSKKLQLSLLASTCLLWTGLLMPVILQAAPVISAKYVQNNGTQLVIEITAGSNPPASAILMQRLPVGTRILASQPEVSNYNPKKSTAKWLLRNLKPGKSTVSITLDQAVKATEISAEIRFKPQPGEKMITIQVKK
jgi:hypothetical protein